MRPRSGPRELLRQVSARAFNPLAMRVAGRRDSPYAILEHVGRRTGMIYRVPVVVHGSPENAIIPLPYGADVNWCRNVRAAGGCTLIWNGRAMAMIEPRLAPHTTVRHQLPSLLWYVLTLTGTRTYLRLRARDPRIAAASSATYGARNIER